MNSAIGLPQTAVHAAPAHELTIEHLKGGMFVRMSRIGLELHSTTVEPPPATTARRQFAQHVCYKNSNGCWRVDVGLVGRVGSGCRCVGRRTPSVLSKNAPLAFAPVRLFAGAAAAAVCITTDRRARSLRSIGLRLRLRRAAALRAQWHALRAAVHRDEHSDSVAKLCFTLIDSPDADSCPGAAERCDDSGLCVADAWASGAGVEATKETTSYAYIAFVTVPIVMLVCLAVWYRARRKRGQNVAQKADSDGPSVAAAAPVQPIATSQLQYVDARQLSQRTTPNEHYVNFTVQELGM
jgi:hypothetical protein